MAMKPAALDKLTGLASWLGAFVAERFPFALAETLEAYDAVARGRDPQGERAIDALRAPFRRALSARVSASPLPEGLPHTTPGTSAATRRQQAGDELVDACDGFLRRTAIEASLTPDERRELLRGMLLTRATDNRLK